MGNDTASTVQTVSVVIPVRNGEAFLAEAIDSVLAQTVAASEIIVVDDGSTDRTAAVTATYGKITYLRQAPSGQAQARNLGVSHANGLYLGFLDADDLWAADKLERQLGVLRAMPGLAAVFAHAIEFYHRDSTGRPVAIGGPKPALLPGAMLIRRDAFAKVGPFDLEGQVGEVIDWYARAVDLALPMQTLDDVLLMRRLHESNLGRQANNPATDYLHTLRRIVERRRDGRCP
jgi:glycosyltransferase involved in cell wall biosynthesis